MTKTWPQNQTSNLALIGISFFRARDALYNNFTRVFDALKNFPIIKYSTNILSSCSSAIFFSRNEPTITRRVSGFGVNSVYTEPILPSIFYSPVIKLIRIFEPRITYRYANSTVKLESFMICSITSSKHVFLLENSPLGIKHVVPHSQRHSQTTLLLVSLLSVGRTAVSFPNLCPVKSRICPKLSSGLYAVLIIYNEL